MNLNKKYSKAAKRTVAVATAASITLGSMSQAATLDSSIDTKGSLAGVFAITAEINKDLAKDTEASTALAGVLAITASLHEDMANNETLVETSNEVGAIEEAEPEEAINYLFANVKEYLNIRVAPDKNAELAGWLLPNRVATIVSSLDGWYEIQSGEVRGFVSSEYSIVGDEALAIYEELSTPYVTCTVSDLNVRAAASKDSEILGHLSKGEKALIDTDLFDVTFEDEDASFVAISYQDKIGYVSSDYIDIYNGEIPTALNPEEVAAYKAEIERAKEEARIAAEKKAQAAASKEAASAGKPATIQNEAVSTGTDDVTLLAALLMCEAGSSYEGMLAVGGVVMNRLRAGYAGSIQGVIYQKGQFTPASSGKLARVIAKGPTQTAMQAAQEAINGVDITGGCKSFRSAKSGHAGVNIGGNVFF